MIGAIITAIGMALLLDGFDIFDFGDIAAQWWPLLVILAGVMIFINDSKNYLWALLVVGFGVLSQARELGYGDINPWEFFWPLVIIVVGISILMNRSVGRQKMAETDRSEDIGAVMGGVDQRNVSEDYKGGRVTAVMGGAKIDLRKATIKQSATIEVFTLMGGIELIVPRNVVIKNQTSVILGGVEDKTEQEAVKSSPVLELVGDVILGGVEIKN